MESETTAAWYEDWFDSPYYSILYKDRNEQEARQFIDRLMAYLQPTPDARILDLACGKGRFSRYLAEKGFDVTGLDLSEHSILHAREFESERLSFFTHDMRLPFRIHYFDYIFNFFTSFGYFDNDRDHIRTLKSIRAGLKDTGVFVLDFFNAHVVKTLLPAQEEKMAGGMHFFIEKRQEERAVVKTIRFNDRGRSFRFKERVMLYEHRELEALLGQAGLRITGSFGNYEMEPFDVASSPRLILIVQKMKS
jgi:SAM-dependent methyltransferase